MLYEYFGRIFFDIVRIFITITSVLYGYFDRIFLAAVRIFRTIELGALWIFWQDISRYFKDI
jgi:hypothetical protein